MFTTPQDYINNYVQILKNEYQLNDLKIDYQGFVGFIMNLFGWTNFDIKQYYDYLYKEGFLATSDETRNLYLHGSTYNYPIDFAIPATASGNLVFDFTQLPVAASNILRREVVLPSTIQISAGNYIFSTTTQYTFIEDRSSVQSTYYCIINPLNSKQQIIASSGTIITVPFIDFTQQVSTTYNFNVSNYDYGTYSQYNLNITDTEQVANLEISVQLSGTTTYIPFNVKHITAFETPLSESVFLTQISNTQLILGTGNGYHGLWIPNSIMQVSLWTTQGANGNSLQRQIANITGALTMTQFDSNNTIIKQNSVVINNNLLKADFYSSTGGSDVLLGLDLKNDIVKWVESRNNLINH